jgi:hypothetical protein
MARYIQFPNSKWVKIRVLSHGTDIITHMQYVASLGRARDRYRLKELQRSEREQEHDDEFRSRTYCL